MFTEINNHKEFETKGITVQDWFVQGKWRVVVTVCKYKIPETEKVEVQGKDRFGRNVTTTERVETGRDIRTRFAYIDCYLVGTDTKFRITVYRRKGQFKYSDSTRPQSSQSVKRFQAMATLAPQLGQDWADAAIGWAEYAYDNVGY